jgi:hypothetical protein
MLPGDKPISSDSAAIATPAAINRILSWMTTGAISGVLRGCRRSLSSGAHSRDPFGQPVATTPFTPLDRYLDDVDHEHDRDGRAQGVQKLEGFTRSMSRVDRQYARY